MIIIKKKPSSPKLVIEGMRSGATIIERSQAAIQITGAYYKPKVKLKTHFLRLYNPVYSLNEKINYYPLPKEIIGEPQFVALDHNLYEIILSEDKLHIMITDIAAQLLDSRNFAFLICQEIIVL